MAEGAFVFAMANPNPEVHPDVAHKYAAVVATGRSDFPNQINNVLAFPGIFAGALQVRASRITEGMKIAAAEALAAVVGDDLAADYVIPSPFDERVAPAVTAAVAAAARPRVSLGAERWGGEGSSPRRPARPVAGLRPLTPSRVRSGWSRGPRASERRAASRVFGPRDRAGAQPVPPDAPSRLGRDPCASRNAGPG